MAKGKRLTEIEKFQKAVEGIDFTKIEVEELNAVVADCMKQSKKAAIQKQIDELQAQLEQL